MPPFLKVAGATTVLLVGVTTAVLVLAAINWRPAAPPTLDEVVLGLTPVERRALEQLCRDAGIAISDFQLITTWQRQIATVPLAIAGGDGHITALRMSGLRLADITPVRALSEVQALWFDANQLAAIPDLSALTKLRELNLRHNQITSLGNDSLPPHLAVLDVGHNRLDSLAGIGAARFLGQLYAGNNAITAADALANHPGLQEVDLDGNRLTSLDPLLASASLRRLYARRNPLSAPPAKPKSTRLEVYTDAMASK